MSELFKNVKVFTFNNTNIKLAENLNGNVTTFEEPTIAHFLGDINDVRLSTYIDQNLKLIGYRFEEKIATTIYMKLVQVKSTGLKFGAVS
ncbi:hypothetical protein [Mariniflexile sp. AS56]|uniref:hypothetical protein n=1 Tax=Mariniflexile sp. AS56 TaxID=3063957 RepID=UPI0026F28BEB|nr:hypothetical protein [Mariniflexile sp. AS56]MDO7171758.1 hypothetical protein [Mariniflexile sp. AS56]